LSELSNSSISSSESSESSRHSRHLAARHSSSTSAHPQALDEQPKQPLGPSEATRESVKTSKSARISKMDIFSLKYSNKKYLSGYLYTIQNGEWVKIYAEIRGRYLKGWKVYDEIAAQAYEPEPILENILSLELSPTSDLLQVIQDKDPELVQDITDSTSKVFPNDYVHYDVSPVPPIPYTCFFSIDDLLFASYSYISANSWIHSVRLSAFEYGQLNLYFSLVLLRVVPSIRIWSDFEIVPL
jgi:hypothetical protein